MLSRRGFLVGLGSVLAAPAVVRAELIMPVKAIDPGAIIADYFINDNTFRVYYRGKWEFVSTVRSMHSGKFPPGFITPIQLGAMAQEGKSLPYIQEWPLGLREWVESRPLNASVKS